MELYIDYILGGIAATLRIAIGHERGEKISLTKVYIIAVPSIIIAGTGGAPMAEWAHLPVSMGRLIAFVGSFFAVGYVYQAYDGKVYLPYINEFVKRQTQPDKDEEPKQ